MFNLNDYYEKYKNSFSEYVDFYRTHSLDEILEFEAMRRIGDVQNVNDAEKMYARAVVDLDRGFYSSKKEYFDSIPQERLEEYIENKSKIALNQLEINALSEEANRSQVFESIKNIEYLSEKDHSLKNEIKSSLAKGIKKGIDGMTLPLVGYVSVAAFVDLLSNASIGDPLTGFVAVAALSFAVSFGGFEGKVIKEWFDKVKNEKNDIDLLKKTGIYDLLLERMSAEKNIKDIEINGRGR